MYQLRKLVTWLCLRNVLTASLLSIIMIGSFIGPVFAQGGVTAGFTVQVNFYFMCVCSLSNVKVVVSDQTGKVVGSLVSPDGSMLVISFRETTPEFWLLVNAIGYASFSYNLPWVVHGSSIITVQNAGGYYYTTILLRSSGVSSSPVFGS